MSKASEYAKVRQAAQNITGIRYKEKENRGTALVNEDGTLYCDGVWHHPLALARWIVETWGEPGISTPQQITFCRRNADDKLHVSSTGEITGTLPCGHSIVYVQTSTSEPYEAVPGHAITRRVWCYHCRRKDPAP